MTRASRVGCQASYSAAGRCPDPCFLPRAVRRCGERCQHGLPLARQDITTRHFQDLGGQVDVGFGIGVASGHHRPIRLRFV